VFEIHDPKVILRDIDEALREGVTLRTAVQKFATEVAG
jgi:hypothetical protein